MKDEDLFFGKIHHEHRQLFGTLVLLTVSSLTAIGAFKTRKQLPKRFTNSLYGKSLIDLTVACANFYQNQ